MLSLTKHEEAIYRCDASPFVELRVRPYGKYD